MLRLRRADGTTLEIEGQPSPFVEICDQEGDVAQLIYTDSSGVIRVVTADDPEASNYARLYDVKFVKILSI